jgi:hypothetical protein
MSKTDLVSTFFDHIEIIQLHTMYIVSLILKGVGYHLWTFPKDTADLTDRHVKFSVNRIFRQAKVLRRNTLTTHVLLF